MLFAIFQYLFNFRGRIVPRSHGRSWQRRRGGDAQINRGPRGMPVKAEQDTFHTWTGIRNQFYLSAHILTFKTYIITLFLFSLPHYDIFHS